MAIDIASEKPFQDGELYRRGVETLLASWEEYARGAAGAFLRYLPGAVAAVFPHGPERAVYNNALLEGGPAPSTEVEAATRPRASTASRCGSTRPIRLLRVELERRGYALDTTTRAMGMALDEVRLPAPRLDLAPADWAEALRIMELPPDFLEAADPAAFEILIARLGGENVAAAIALDHDGDRGIYNVGTLEHARRRGLGTALTTLLVHDAFARGCETASLQSTQTAERVYASVGFRDLGRILEYVPTPGEPPRL